MSTILVTGGLGFIGSNFVKLLLQKRDTSYSIVNLDAMSFGANPKNLADIGDLSNYRFVKGWTTDDSVVQPLMSDVDVVVNFAAETHVDRSVANPKAFFQSNTVGTMTLLEHARKHDARFIQISTDEVYGSAPSDYSFTEKDKLTPSSPYSTSKAAADLFVATYHQTYGLHTTILRCTNNFGPNQFPEKFIPKAIASIMTGRKIPIYGNGLQVRDWIYVQDFCRAIELAMTAGPAGAIYNVSAGNEVSNLEIVTQILKRLKMPETMLQFVEDRPGHDIRYSLDSTKIRSELGWKVTTSLTDRLNETVDWYIKNESWWRPLISDRVLSPSPWKENWATTVS